MVRWDDKHIYNWIGWMRSLLAMREKINDWTTTSPIKTYKFPVFMANWVILSPILFVIIGLMAIPQTKEWLITNLTKWVHDRIDIKKSNLITPVLIILGIFIIAYMFTWGLLNVIMETKRMRQEKQMMTYLDAIERSRQEWEEMHSMVEHLVRSYKNQDFIPKKQIKSHHFVDTPKIRIFTRDEQPIRRDRTTRRYYNYINNE